jgi:hypothetical protein
MNQSGVGNGAARAGGAEKQECKYWYGWWDSCAIPPASSLAAIYLAARKRERERVVVLFWVDAASNPRLREITGVRRAERRRGEGG